MHLFKKWCCFLLVFFFFYNHNSIIVPTHINCDVWCQCFPACAQSSGLGFVTYVEAKVGRGTGSREENLGESSPTAMGFQESQQDWAQMGCPWPDEPLPLCWVTQVSPWNSASTGWLFQGLEYPSIGSLAPASEDLVFTT